MQQTTFQQYWKDKVGNKQFKCDYWTEVKCEGELEVYHTSVSNKILYTACNKCNRKHNISYYKKPKK